MVEILRIVFRFFGLNLDDFGLECERESENVKSEKESE